MYLCLNDNYDDDDEVWLLGISRLAPCLMSRRQQRGVTKQTNNYPPNHTLLITTLIIKTKIYNYIDYILDD